MRHAREANYRSKTRYLRQKCLGVKQRQEIFLFENVFRKNFQQPETTIDQSNLHVHLHLKEEFPRLEASKWKMGPSFQWDSSASAVHVPLPRKIATGNGHLILTPPRIGRML